MNKNTQNPNRIALAIALVAVFAGAAHADDLRQVQVKYADLDVNTAAGAKVLYQRINRAADQVCEYPETRNLAVLGKVKTCTDHAVAAAVGAVNSPVLTALYEVKMGRTPVTQLVAAR
jgi:UrcA family protein